MATTVTHDELGITAAVESQERLDEAKKRVRLEGGPIIELGSAYQRDRRFRVTHLELRWTRGKLHSATASGPVLKADGSEGLRRQHDYWYITPHTGTWRTPPPPWVLALIDRFGAVPTWEETA